MLIKIAYIIDRLETNLAGTENQLIKMINGLDEVKFRKDLICFNNSPWLEANTASLKCKTTVIEINQFKAFSTYLNFLNLINYLREYKPDVVHTFFPVGNIAGVIAARLAGIKNIISSRRDYGEWMNGHYLFTTKFANRFVKKIIVNSNQVKELTYKKENIANGKVDVIFNGININTFKNINKNYILKESLNIPKDNKIVGIVGNFRPMKHHYTFIRAAKEVLKIRNDVDFFLIGDGESRKEMEELGNSLGSSPKLHFTGKKDASHYFSIMDIGVNCSENEGLSNAVIEYMTAGIPCVVSNAGGNPDLITSNINGYTFELDDYKTLASLILRLLDDEETRQRFIKAAREKIEKEMSLEAMLSKYEELYEKMANEK